MPTAGYYQPKKYTKGRSMVKFTKNLLKRGYTMEEALQMWDIEEKNAERLNLTKIKAHFADIKSRTKGSKVDTEILKLLKKEGIKRYPHAKPGAKTGVKNPKVGKRKTKKTMAEKKLVEEVIAATQDEIITPKEEKKIIEKVAEVMGEKPKRGKKSKMKTYKQHKDFVPWKYFREVYYRNVGKEKTGPEKIKAVAELWKVFKSTNIEQSKANIDVFFAEITY